MKKYGMILALAVAALSAFGETVKTATQPWVRNYVATNTTSLTPATNYTNNALADFAATGTVWRSLSYGTTNRWTDATGCVWEIAFALGNPISDTPGAVWNHYEWWPDDGLGKAYMTLDGIGWEQYTELPNGWTRFTFTYEATRSDGGEGALPFDVTFVRRLEIPITNLVGRVALTNDVPGIIREHSLGGIWDSQLEVWWTPIMENGALRYCATTNINMEANQ